MKLKGEYIVDCKDKKGNWKWSEKVSNIVTTTGITHIIARGLDTDMAETGDWYVGIVGTSASAVAAADAMGSHAGWTESTLYAEDTRPEWSKTQSGVSIGNTAAKATFTLDVDGTTIGGAFLSSSKTAGGSSGILMSVAAFSAKKTGDSGDKLEVSYKIVGSDDESS